MSSLQVRVQTVDEVSPHPNADRMAVLTIGGHNTCTALERVDGEYRCPYTPGDKVLYVPPDAIIPDEVAEEWGIKDYLGSGNRVKTVRLRGFVSRGFVVPPPMIEGGIPEVGTDLAGHFGIEKYEPPKPVSDELVPEVPGFLRYTDIERIQNYPDIFQEGEEIIATEKIHGTNSRVGSILNHGRVAGTRRNQVAAGCGSKYEFPLSLNCVNNLLDNMRAKSPNADSIVLFGEIFGKSVQGNLPYGIEGGDYGYRAFDIAIDGEYLDFDDFEKECRRCDVETVPVLYRGPFYIEAVEKVSDGQTTIGADHVREGVVVRPVQERWDDKLGRVILKRIGDSYEVNQYQWSDSH